MPYATRHAAWSPVFGRYRDYTLRKRTTLRADVRLRHARKSRANPLWTRAEPAFGRHFQGPWLQDTLADRTSPATETKAEKVHAGGLPDHVVFSGDAGAGNSYNLNR